MVKYRGQFTRIGPLVSEFVENGILVLFGENAPEELAEFAVLHDGKALTGILMPGDRINIDQDAFAVLAVGEVANANLANLGHLVLKFNGLTDPEMPGDVCVEARPCPRSRSGAAWS